MSKVLTPNFGQARDSKRVKRQRIQEEFGSAARGLGLSAGRSGTRLKGEVRGHRTGYSYAPHMSETADTSLLMEVAERWLRDTEHLI